MCGIIGFNWEDKQLLNQALKEIQHRGPDDSGKVLDKEVSLGHRRLSILDLSKSGKQPMSNEEETIWITFNGEIYNFKELKRILQHRHNFKSNTDTEVLIHLYEEQGIEMLKKLNGMFSFCIYDSKKKIFFLARDRVGIKPIYYYNQGKKFIFCSEIKGILQDKGIKRKVNLQGVGSFLSFRANIEEETCFQGIKKLMPGNYLIYDLKRKQITKIQKYWDLSFNDQNKSQKFLERKLQSLLEDSVKKRLMADVPFGAYLSGGVDSGTIVSIMNKFCSKPLETFSVGFEVGEHDEVNEAKFLAEKLKTNHHELLIKEDSVKQLPKIIYHLDEPMADPTSIPIYFLSKYAKKRCTVVLTGEGADEIFAGYPQYKFMQIHKSFIRPIPRSLRTKGAPLIEKIPSKILDIGLKYASDLGEEGRKRIFNFIKSNNYSEQYLNQDIIFNDEEKKEALIDYPGSLYKRYYPQIRGSLNSQLKFDFKGRMVEDLLMKLDKNTMAFAIEGRVPFLDHRLVELASQIPERLKLKNLIQDKFILRQSVKNLLPQQTQKRKKKHFFVPINNWFNNELLQLKEDLLNEKYIKKQGIFNPRYIRKINNNYKSSKLFYARQLWSLITFQIWYKQYIQNEKIQIK